MTDLPTPPRRFDYPLSLDVAGARALVVGGDHEAVDKAKRLVAAGALVTIVTTAPSEALRASGLPFLQRALQLDGDLDGVKIVIVAPDARGEAPAIWALRQRHGYLVSSIDDVPHCDFASPAFVDVGDVKIALSSGGRAPAILKRLREDLAAALVTDAMKAFVARVSALRDEEPAESRIDRVKAAVQGFGLEIRVRFPGSGDGLEEGG